MIELNLVLEDSKILRIGDVSKVTCKNYNLDRDTMRIGATLDLAAHRPEKVTPFKNSTRI